MTSTYNLSISKNPNFQTVNSLTNLVFDRNNVRSGNMATENEIQQLWQDIVRLEERIDYCCRDIVFWDFRVRIRNKYGDIVTDYLENRTTGITRRGKNFTMTLPIKAIPKYEAGIAPTSGSATNFVDGDTKKCILNGVQYYGAIDNLCGLIYRGASGEYYEMSVRKDTSFLAPMTGWAINALHVDVNGNETTASYFPQSSSNCNQNKFLPSQHAAYTDTDNNILINVFHPIGDSVYVSSCTTQTKPYGRIYYMDLRDVTLGN